MQKIQKIRSHLRVGKIYRREQLEVFSSSIDRDLRDMLLAGIIKKIDTGLYYIPKKTVFGDAPPDRKEIVKAFLKDTRFLLTSFNDYNILGLGTTQLYNNTVVYNHKRHGKLKIGGYYFDFKIVKSFPLNLTKEFLLVDLMNNLDNLPEDSFMIKEQVKRKILEFNKDRVKRIVKSFGKIKTKKFFQELLK